MRLQASGDRLDCGLGVTMKEVDLRTQHVGEAGAPFVDVVVTARATEQFGPRCQLTCRTAGFRNNSARESDAGDDRVEIPAGRVGSFLEVMKVDVRPLGRSVGSSERRRTVPPVFAVWAFRITQVKTLSWRRRSAEYPR